MKREREGELRRSEWLMRCLVGVCLVLFCSVPFCIGDVAGSTRFVNIG
jgi:hypothetical protein